MADSGPVAAGFVQIQPLATGDLSDVYPAIRLHGQVPYQFAIKVVPGSAKDGGAGDVVEGVQSDEWIFLILVIDVEPAVDDTVFRSNPADGKAATVAEEWFDRGSSWYRDAHKQRNLAALLDPASDMT